MNSVTSAAYEYLRLDWPVLPLREQSKVPATAHGKNDASTDPKLISNWFPPGTKRNIGVLTGEKSGLLVVDLDPRNGGNESFERLERTYGNLPPTRSVRTGSGGRHLFFRLPVGDSGFKDRPNVEGYSGVDLKADGYVVAAPSIHPDTGTAYEWENDLPVADAPAFLLDLARGQKRIKSATTKPGGSIPEGGRNDALFRKACKLRSANCTPEAILAAIEAENHACCSPPLDREEVQRIAQSAIRYEPDTEHPETDLGNARRLVELMGGNVRYEGASKIWFIWDGRHWTQDKNGQVERFAKDVADNLLATAALANDHEALKRRMAFAYKSQSAPRIAAMIELAKTEPGIPIQFAQFDCQPHLLNVGNGIVDLKTGDLQPHSREAFITQIIERDYEKGAPCPVFERFVGEILNGDSELIEYAQRVAGYAATGETREQCFFILHGAGANGKSTFLNAIRDALGDYAKHTPTDTLLARAGGASNDLMRLAGSRFVTASEANADQRLAEALLKQVTGDEPITARYLFREFVTFPVTFKLFLATNHLPHVSGTDAAIWRRIRTIPFNRVFATGEQDRSLAAKLAAERAGILSWIVRGAARWFSEGLPTPSAVQQATDEYRTEMDSVGQFLDECCAVERNAIEPASRLYNCYRLHANDNGHVPVSGTMFGRQLTARGFPSEKRGGIMLRRGVRYVP